MLQEYVQVALQAFLPTFLCALFFIMFLIFNKHFNRDINSFFYAIIIVTLCLCVSDIFQGYYERLTYRTNTRMLFACISYSIRPAILYTFVLLYLRNTKTEYKLLMALPIVINTIIIFLAFKFPFVFSYTDDNQIVRGPLVSIPFVASVIYFFIIIFFGIKNLRTNDFRELLFIIIIFVVSTAATLLEMIGRFQGFIAAVAIFGTIFYYMFFLASNYTTDHLTGAYIRSKLFSRLNGYNDEYTLIVYDVNNLKLINDTKGHMEGDKAIKTIARIVMENLPSNGSLYRFAGDEFVIFLPFKNEEKTQHILNNIKIGLYGTGYSAAVGAVTRNGSETLDEILEKADALMYKDKKAYKNLQN